MQHWFSEPEASKESEEGDIIIGQVNFLLLPFIYNNFHVQSHFLGQPFKYIIKGNWPYIFLNFFQLNWSQYNVFFSLVYNFYFELDYNAVI